jgi:hypothetical protein
VPQVLLHAYSQDKEGMLVGQVDELGNGSALAVDLLLEGLFPGGACSHTDSQHPGRWCGCPRKRLALGRVEADGWLPLVKESQCLLKCRVVRAEDVDIVEVGQDESVWAKGGGQVSEGTRAKMWTYHWMISSFRTQPVSYARAGSRIKPAVAAFRQPSSLSSRFECVALKRS